MNLRKLTLLIGSTLTVMSGATIAPSLPQIQNTFSDTENVELLTRLVLTIPALFIAVGSPLLGTLNDKIGRLPVLFVSLIIYTIGGTAGLYLNSITSIIISRAVLGIGVAGIMTSFTTLIGDYYQGEERNQMMGLQAAFMALGGFVFLSSGGILADIGWRWPFSTYFFALVVFPLAWIFLKEPDGDSSEQNGSPKTVFLHHEKVLVAITFFLGLLFMIIFYMVPVQLPFYLKQIDVESNTLAGIALAALTLMGGIASLFYRKLKSFLTFNMLYAFLFTMAATGYFIISFADSYSLVITAQIISGLGFGLFMPNAVLCLMNMTPLHLRGRIVGGFTTALFLGQFLSPIVVQPLAKTVGLSDSFMIASLVLAGIAFIYFGGIIKNQLNNAKASATSRV